MRILLAEDDQRLGSMIKGLLEQDQFQVDWVTSGDLAYMYAKKFSYSILILDWMMPKETGLSVCQRLRNTRYPGGILILTSKDSIDDRITGFDGGADDYLIKPFKYKELWARIRAINRRNVLEHEEDILRIDDLELHSSTRSVYKCGQEIRLTGREFQIFYLLAVHYGQVLSRELILNCVWGEDAEVSPSILDTFINLLRKKVEQDGKRLIYGVRGQGYKLGAQRV